MRDGVPEEQPPFQEGNIEEQIVDAENVEEDQQDEENVVDCEDSDPPRRERRPRQVFTYDRLGEPSLYELSVQPNIHSFRSFPTTHYIHQQTVPQRFPMAQSHCVMIDSLVT